MTEADEKRAREICKAATVGPWRYCGASDGTCPCGLIWAGHQNDTVARSYSGENESSGRLEDATFIAESRTLLPACLDEIERLRALVLEACEIGQRLGTVRTNEIGQEYQRDHCERLLAIASTLTSGGKL